MTNTTPTPGALDLDSLEALTRAAMRKAYNLGQTYWQQADSEYGSQWRKADETAAKFAALVDETVETLARRAAQPSAEKAEGELSDAEIASLIGRCTRYEAEQDLFDLCRDAIAASRRAAGGEALVAPAQGSAPQAEASEGETLDEKAENALLWCYRRMKNSYGRLPFIEEAIAGLRERSASARCRAEGGVTLERYVEERATPAAERAAAPADQRNTEWGHDLQARLMAASQDITESEDARQVMAEAACLLAALTGRPPAQQASAQEGSAA